MTNVVGANGIDPKTSINAKSAGGGRVIKASTQRREKMTLRLHKETRLALAEVVSAIKC
jgi:hypothetical protein